MSIEGKEHLLTAEELELWESATKIKAEGGKWSRGLIQKLKGISNKVVLYEAGIRRIETETSDVVIIPHQDYTSVLISESLKEAEDGENKVVDLKEYRSKKKKS